jgi:hypothetical protein
VCPKPIAKLGRLRTALLPQNAKHPVDQSLAGSIQAALRGLRKPRLLLNKWAGAATGVRTRNCLVRLKRRFQKTKWRQICLVVGVKVQAKPGVEAGLEAELEAELEPGLEASVYITH